MTTRTNNRFRAASVAIACVLVVTACAASDEEAGTTADSTVAINPTTMAPETEPESDASTTAEDTSTTSSSTTEATTTTPPETTEETTTVPSDPDADPRESELIAALEAFTEAWAACLSQLPNCDLNSLTATRASDQLEQSVGILRGANTNGWSVTNIDGYRTQFESVEFVDERTAVVTACNEDATEVFDGALLLSDEFTSQRTEWTFELINGSWKATTGIELATTSGEDQSLCSF